MTTHPDAIETALAGPAPAVSRHPDDRQAWHTSIGIRGVAVSARWWLIVPGLLFGAMLPAQQSGLPFAVTPAVSEIAPLERFYDGAVEAVNRATVSAQTAGRIAEIFYDVDDYVEAGSPIIRFTDVEQQAGLRRAEANLKEAQARLKEAEDEFERASGLYEAGSGSRREYEQALAGRDAASARVTAARSAVEQAQQQAEYTLVRAPYSGILIERHVEVGESVTVGQPLTSGLSLEALRVTVDLPQTIAAEVRERRQATVITEEGEVTPTHITVFPFADEATNTFRVRLELPPGQFALYPGMFVKVAFVVGESQRLLIPGEALVRRSEVTGVYVVGDNDDVRFRQVRIGNRFGERVEILSGLGQGDRVATDPVQAGIYVKSSAARNHGE
ncbi:MAG TPA: efflux RND transporter periplasmic adaptor subunit [Pseudomonadales bacterium]|nr:efflux RND transporter periplasmic adaptor subunit [Pseudomonadales bacterium]